jgi:O-acetyl-ADP-ribose deacetylase (regulator of RNase III)
MRIEAARGDITRQTTDAIVNAANSSLLGGGGVDGAIHQAAGPKLREECREVRKAYPAGFPVGQAVATGAYDLPCKWVIHTVGPNAHRGQTDPALLASCFTESLRVADQMGATSISFPAISAGAYGWDPAEVAEVAVAAVQHYAGNVSLVRFVLFSDALLKEFANLI